MSKTDLYEEIVQKLKTFFEKKKGISLVFLFGSVVSRQMTNHSDIDVGMLFDRIPDFHEINNVKEDLSSLLNRDIDIVVLNEASPIIKMQVLKNGLLIFRKDKNSFSNFYGDTVKQYDDLKIVRKKCEDNILKGRIYAR